MLSMNTRDPISDQGSLVILQNPGQPVSRILSGGNPAWMDIYLDEWLPTRSSGLPGDGWETGRSCLLPDVSPA
jgi:hypothetical protein